MTAVLLPCVVVDLAWKSSIKASIEVSVLFLERGDDVRVWIRRGGWSGMSMTKVKRGHVLLLQQFL